MARNTEMLGQSPGSTSASVVPVGGVDYAIFGADLDDSADQSDTEIIYMRNRLEEMLDFVSRMTKELEDIKHQR